MDTDFQFFPKQASTAAEQVDNLYIFLIGVSAFFTILIFLLIFGFVIKYRRGARADRSASPNEKFWVLEITWTLIPLGLTMLMFGWGAQVFYYIQQAPADCIEVNVLGKQWMWKVHHANGKREINTLHVPAGRPVKLRLISEDVIHSFYAPSFRVKQDVLPGRYTTLWFEATTPGRYHLFCAEYCGESHSRMVGEIIVQEPADYASWLQGGTFETLEKAGERLFTQLRCGSCHRGSGDARCPPLAGVYGRTVQLADGSTVIADEDYLRESLLDPTAKVVAGYRRIMPTYEPNKELIGEEGIVQLIAYMKSLSKPSLNDNRNAPEQNGAEQTTEEQQ